MFELIVEILHNDNRETIEPYSQCEIFQHSRTGERRRLCKAFKYPTQDACLAQLDELNARWLAEKSKEGKILDWTEWKMRCERVAGPLTS